MNFASLKLSYSYYLKGLGEGQTGRKIALLERFQNYLNFGRRRDLREVSQSDILGFFEALENQGLSPNTLNNYASILRRLFVWLYKNNLILSYSAELVPRMKTEKTHKAIFSRKEMELFLESIESPLRDRCYFELLYSSGLRCSEGISLFWEDIQLKERILKVRQGKGGRQRYIPFSYQAARILKLWKDASFHITGKWVFPGEKGSHLVENTMRGRFRTHLKAAGIKKKGLSIHSIRHSCATHLLEGGADIRYVSELLGHSSLESTVGYTHRSQESQRRHYRMYHPRENGYDKEVDEAYKNELERLRGKFQQREGFVERYIKKY